MTNAYKHPSLDIDIFFHYSHIGVKGNFAPTGATYGLSLGNHGFTDNTLQYETPRIAGFKGVGSIHLDNTNKIDYAYIAGGSYKTGDLIVGSVYARQSNSSNILYGIDLYGVARRIYATWHDQNIEFGVSVENIDTEGMNLNYLFASVIIKLDEMQTKLKMSAGRTDEGLNQGYNVTIAAFHELIKEVQLYTLISYATLNNNAKPKVFTLGANYNLQFTLD